MATVYIDSNATGTDAGTSWTDAYPSAITAFSTELATGPHEFRIAYNHQEDSASGGTITVVFTEGAGNINTVVSTDPADDTYRKGALFNNTTIQHMYFEGSVYFQGVTIKNNRGIYVSGNHSSPGVTVVFEDCVLELTRNSNFDQFNFQTAGSNAAGSYTNAINTEFITANAGQKLDFGHAGYVVFRGCTLSGTALTNIIDYTSTDGCQAQFYSCDLSNATNLFLDTNDLDNQVQHFDFYRCLLPAGFNSPNYVNTSARINIGGCGVSGNDDDYFYSEFVDGNRGLVVTDAVIYRTDGATYDGTNGHSLEILPTDNVIEQTMPLRAKLGEYELDLTSTNILTFYLAVGSSATITPADFTNATFWLEGEQNDATDNALGLVITTKATDILATPTQLTDSTEAWSNMTQTYKDYFQIAITTTAVSGMTNGQVTMYVCCALFDANEEYYICPLPEIT